MSHGQGKPQNGQGNVREKSGNFVRAHGWTPWHNLPLRVRYNVFLWAQSQICFLFNSLVPGRPRCHFETAIFNFLLLIGIFTSSKDNALRLMPRDLTHDKSTLVQVMAWCHQATSHYLSQCWPSSMLPYGVTRPQWVLIHHLITLSHGRWR